MSTANVETTSLLTVRRVISMITAALLLGAGIVLGVAAPSQAVSFTADNGISYNLDETEHTATVTGYNSGLGSVVDIPEAVAHDGETYSVTTIGYRAFRTKQLTAVTIPDSVTTIGGGAFFNNLLTAVTIPGNVTDIGASAFDVNELTEVTIPESVTSVGESAFANNLLSKVNIPASVATIGPSAFQDNELTEVTIPSSVTVIGDGAFGNNVDLVVVLFEGPAPADFTPRGSGWRNGSLGYQNSELTVLYRQEFGAPNGGFTSPEWQGYNARARYIYTVTFDTNGGSEIDSASVTEADRLPTPAEPTRDGHTFTGWYTDVAATVPYNFDTEVTGDLTLYAGWDRNTYQITFDTNGGSDISSVEIAYGDTVSAPTDSPIRDGHTFTGWYTDVAATLPYDFDTPVDGALTLYAGWEKQSVKPGPGEDPADEAADPSTDPGTDPEDTNGTDSDPGTGSHSTPNSTQAPTNTTATTATTATLSKTGSDLNPWVALGGVALLVAGASVLVTRRTPRARTR